MRRPQVPDLGPHGGGRPYRLVAAEEARARGIAVIATDLGYVRPDWLTLEYDGMTTYSRFPREPDAIRALAAELPELVWIDPRRGREHPAPLRLAGVDRTPRLDGGRGRQVDRPADRGVRRREPCVSRRRRSARLRPARGHGAGRRGGGDRRRADESRAAADGQRPVPAGYQVPRGPGRAGRAHRLGRGRVGDRVHRLPPRRRRPRRRPG